MLLFLLWRSFNANYYGIFHRPRKPLEALGQGVAGIFEGRGSLAGLKSKARTNGGRVCLRRSQLIIIAGRRTGSLVG